MFKVEQNADGSWHTVEWGLTLSQAITMAKEAARGGRVQILPDNCRQAVSLIKAHPEVIGRNFPVLD